MVECVAREQNKPEVAGSQPAGSRAYSSFYLSNAPASLNRSLKEVYTATDLIQNGCFDVQQKQANVLIKKSLTNKWSPKLKLQSLSIFF